MKIELPLLVLGFGDYKSGRIFATENQHGVVIMPVFTDAELAEDYRRARDLEIGRQVLPVAVSHLGYDEPQSAHRLGCLALATRQHVEDVLRLAGVVHGPYYVALNPPDSSSNTVLCYEVDEFIELLGSS